MKRGEIGGVIPLPKGVDESMLQGLSLGRILRLPLALGPFHGEARAKGPESSNLLLCRSLSGLTQGRGNASLLRSLVRLRELQRVNSRRAGLKPASRRSANRTRRSLLSLLRKWLWIP